MRWCRDMRGGRGGVVDQEVTRQGRGGVVDQEVTRDRGGEWWWIKR